MTDIAPRSIPTHHQHLSPLIPSQFSSPSLLTTAPFALVLASTSSRHNHPSATVAPGPQIKVPKTARALNLTQGVFIISASFRSLKSRANQKNADRRTGVSWGFWLDNDDKLIPERGLRVSKVKMDLQSALGRKICNKEEESCHCCQRPQLKRIADITASALTANRIDGKSAEVLWIRSSFVVSFTQNVLRM